MAGRRRPEAQSYAISLPYVPAELPRRGRSLSLQAIVRGFSKDLRGVSRSLKTPLAFPCSAMDVYRAVLSATQTRLLRSTNPATLDIIGPGDRRLADNRSAAACYTFYDPSATRERRLRWLCGRTSP